MALEAPEHSKLLRQRLSELFDEWSEHFAAVIRHAQKANEVRADFDPEEAGAALLEAWHGAMLRMKSSVVRPLSSVSGGLFFRLYSPSALEPS